MSRRAVDDRVESGAAPTVGIVVYGDLDARSGGYRYDRELADHLLERGWKLEVVSLPERSWSPPAVSAPGLVARLEAAYRTVQRRRPVRTHDDDLPRLEPGDEPPGWVDRALSPIHR